MLSTQSLPSWTVSRTSAAARGQSNIGTAATQSTGQNKMNTAQQVTSATPSSMFLRALDHARCCSAVIMRRARS